MRHLIIGALLLVSTTSAFAKFECGPHAYTYGVMAPGAHQYAGARCVVFPNNHSFAWYGEGQWDGAKYRHLGFARRINDEEQFIASASDLTSDGMFNRNIQIHFPQQWSVKNPPSTIKVRGAWEEDWVLIQDGSLLAWSPLPPAKGCGALQQWKVQGHSAIRCVLQDGSWLTAWYGQGDDYRHIGAVHMTSKSTKWGAVDLCLPGLACGKANWGGLNVEKNGNTIHVTGAWNETWKR